MNNTPLLERTKRKLVDGPDTPPWWPLVQIGLGASFVLYLLVSLGSGGDQADATGTGPAAIASGPPTVTTPAPVADAPADAPTNDTTDAPAQNPETGDTRTVEVAHADGSGAVAVPAAAKATADVAAVALFTGDFSRVPFVPGTSAPSPAVTWTGAQVVDVSARPLADDLIQFRHTVDPDGGGPEPARTVTVHVADVNGTWAYRGS